MLKATIKNRQILEHAKKELFKDELNHIKIGKLLSDHHTILRDSLRVSTDKIDKMIKASLDAGALGAKINGSGGGGCMFAYAPKNSEAVASAIESVGGRAYIIGKDEGTKILSRKFL